MTKPMWMRGLGVWGGGALLAAWLVSIVVSIHDEPPGGAASLNSLKDDTVTALHAQDADGFQSLLDGGTVADDYAKSYLQRLGGTAAKNAQVAVRKAAGSDFVVTSGPGTCTAWQVTEKDNRWYLDETPPVLGTLCGAAR